MKITKKLTKTKKKDHIFFLVKDSMNRAISNTYYMRTNENRHKKSK